MPRLALTLLLLLLLASPAAAIPTCGPGPQWAASCPAGTTIYDVHMDFGLYQFPEFEGMTLISPSTSWAGTLTFVNEAGFLNGDVAQMRFSFTADLTNGAWSAHIVNPIVELGVYDGSLSASFLTFVTITTPNYGTLTGSTLTETHGRFFQMPFAEFRGVSESLWFNDPGGAYASSLDGILPISLRPGTPYVTSNPRDPVVTPPPPPIARVPEPSTLLLAGLGVGAGVLALRRR